MLEAYVFCCVVYKLIKYECLITKACQGYTDNPSTHEKNCLHFNIEKFHSWSVPLYVVSDFNLSETLKIQTSL